MNKKKHFGLIEMIGSIILLIIDPQRKNNKKYLDDKYLDINKKVGAITIIVIILLVVTYLITQ